MTDAELARLRELAEKATPGPWEDIMAYQRGDIWSRTKGVKNEHICSMMFIVNDDRKSNAAFIAAARTAVPALIAEVERLWSIKSMGNLELAREIANGGPLTREAVEARAAHVIGAAFAELNAEAERLRTALELGLEIADGKCPPLKAAHDEFRRMARTALERKP